MTEPQKLFNTDEAAAYLRVLRSTLQYWRMNGKGPHSFHLGARVMYAREDLDNYIAERRNATGKVTDAAQNAPANPDGGGDDR